MAYITDADIEERLGSATYVQLADDDGDGVADAGVVAEARLGAEGEVNSHLARRFAAPIDLDVHPELAGLLKSVTLDLAEYRLRVRRPPFGDAALRRYQDSINWLRDIAEGSVELPSAAAVAPAKSKGLIAETAGNERLLSRDELSGY